MKRIILAFDSFKGCASSQEIADAARQGIAAVFPKCETVVVPVADGGEGTAEAICSNIPVERVSCRVHDPLMNPMEASYGITADGSTAILEMAAASGLPLVPMEKRNPLFTTTWGTGELIADALRHGCRRVVMGIGGSATNDAGIGLLAALGYRFLDERDKELPPVGQSLARIARVDESSVNELLREASFTIACDVNNPFYGSRGAAAIYAPQKGASPDEVAFLEKGMIHYAQVIQETKQMDISEIPGGGAAGGLGGGVLPFLNAELQSGIDIVLDMLHFGETIQGADLIFTGEGKLDKQTGMGKALGGILRYAKQESVPVVAIGGCVEACEMLNEMGFSSVFSIQPAPVSLQEAMNRDFALKNIRQVVTQIMRTIQIGIHG
ncbi:MAG TPA: glycerate kinase [Candidatus Barnesiella excrementigallinarum]|nr:glycerate kinase [Candidatus Barnesiella excrementigallinarum]